MNSATDTMVARRNELLGPAYRLFYEEPVHIVRGQGVWLYDDDGRKFLDMYNNVPHVGHCHPHVVDALTKQIGILNTHTRYLHGNVLNYAERLTNKFAAELDTAMFSCTGSEANELAMRIARACTGGTGFIVTEFAYHGNSQATYEISVEDIPAQEVPAYVVSIPAPDVYRGEYRGDDAGVRYAEHVDQALKTLASRGVRPAAFIVDTIMSSSGVVDAPRGFLSTVAEKVRDAGALFIADEVQPGFGRTGEHWWGYEADDFVPDIVTMGKPMGNGHPLAATVTRRELIDEFSRHAHYFNTFGGNPVSCAAGLAVLDVIENENLVANALEVGRYLSDGIRSLAEKFPVIGDVRGKGFFKAVEFVADPDTREPARDFAPQVANLLRAKGVLTGSIGPDENILKLRPPMIFSEAHADFFLDTLAEVLGQPGLN